jgi:hypothetical protein
MMNEKRWIAYHNGPVTHLDHLGVLCIELGLPLVTPDHPTYLLGQKIYPQLHIELIEEENILSFLAQNCDTLFGCGKYWTASLHTEFALFFNKKMRFVFCPHGNSDKGRTLHVNGPHPMQDVVLFYGEQMRKLWEKTGMLRHIQAWTFSGNYRKVHYAKHKEHYASLVAPIFAKFSASRKTLLYAPTWPDKENPTPVVDAIEPLMENLGDDLQLLLKLHPLFLEKHPYFCERYQDNAYVAVVPEWMPIYPLLEEIDLYLGDFSSIAYDVLSFDHPLYFLIDDRSSWSSTDLSRVGDTFSTEQIALLFRRMRNFLSEDREKYKKARNDLYEYAFVAEEAPSLLRARLSQLLL